MKTLILKSILAIALCGFVCAETVQDTKVPYKLGVFDIITIDVTGTPTEAPIALFCAIEPDGHVQLGSGYGSVRIAGLTAEEAQEAIIKHLTGTAYMLSNVPAVTVRLQRMYVEQRIAGMPHPPMPMPYGLHLPALHFQPPQPVFSPPYAVPQPYMVPQQDDGYMNLGTYGLVYVKGLTDDEVRKAIEFHLAGYWERATAKVNAQVEDFLVQRRAPQESTRSRVARSGITIQQPSTGTFHISTTVTAPDSGKVLGGSLRRFSEGQVEATQGETLAQLSAMQAPQQQRPERERQIMRQLDMPVTVDIDLSFSLEKAVNMLCEQIDIVPHIDQAALRESGYRTDLLDNTHIIRANAMKARSVLNAILEPHGLAWVVNNGRLTITTKKHAREMKLERWYFVGDLDHDPMMFSGIFMSVIEPDSWMQGDVYIDVHATTQSLVVRQTETVHAQIEDLLGQIRNLRDGKHPVPQTAYSLPLQSSIAQQQRPESERWILQQLERPLVVTRDTLLPLDENLEMLAKICNDTSIPYYLDVAALREAGVQPNVLVSTPQTINLSLIDDARPMKDLLNTILDQHGLTWVVKNEMLVITSKQAARGAKIVRMHYVGDLDPNFGKIMGTIMTVIDPESWMDGDSFMDMHYPTQSLAIRQFEDNHAQIEDLLGQIRQMNDEKQVATVPAVEVQTNQRPLTLRERMRARATASPRIYR